MILGILITAAVGILCVIFGVLIGKKQKISLLHDYHYNKVTEENKATFCALVGRGLLLIGAGILASAVLLGVTESALSFLAMAVGFIAGFGLIIYAGQKYNR